MQVSHARKLAYQGLRSVLVRWSFHMFLSISKGAGAPIQRICVVYIRPTRFIDHAIPINKTDLGEHRLGNLVPSCKKCNDEKHFADFRTFLRARSDYDRIRNIEDYMAIHQYSTLGDNQTIKLIIEQAHAEAKELAYRYIKIIEAVLASDSSESEEA